jgi:hypothetical protein
MNNANFVEGVNIIYRYMKEKGLAEDYSLAAVHDQIWFGSYDTVTDEADRKKLMELGWFEDTDSWSCFA